MLFLPKKKLKLRAQGTFLRDHPAGLFSPHLHPRCLAARLRNTVKHISAQIHVTHQTLLYIWRLMKSRDTRFIADACPSSTVHVKTHMVHQSKIDCYAFVFMYSIRQDFESTCDIKHSLFSKIRLQTLLPHL